MPLRRIGRQWPSVYSHKGLQQLAALIRTYLLTFFRPFNLFTFLRFLRFSFFCFFAFSRFYVFLFFFGLLLL